MQIQLNAKGQLENMEEYANEKLAFCNNYSKD